MVKHEDYEKLQQECEALKDENERLISALENAKRLNIRLGAVNFNMVMGNANYREIAARAIDDVAETLRQQINKNGETEFVIRAFSRVADEIEKEAERYRNGEIEL